MHSPDRERGLEKIRPQLAAEGENESLVELADNETHVTPSPTRNGSPNCRDLPSALFLLRGDPASHELQLLPSM